MTQSKKSDKYSAPTIVPTNGSNDNHYAAAETAAPPQDLPRHPNQSPEDLDEGGGDSPPAASTAQATIADLDEALGDEEALRHELLDTAALPIEVRQPRSREYFAVHPTYQRLTELVQHTPEGSLKSSYYLMAAHIKGLIEAEDKKTVLLVLCQSLRSRAWFWFPINLDGGGNDNVWNSTSRGVVDDIRARQYFGRRVSLRKSGGQGYFTKWAPSGHAEPTWPDKSQRDLLYEAFLKANLYIDSLAHPVFLDLEGAV